MIFNEVIKSFVSMEYFYGMSKNRFELFKAANVEIISWCAPYLFSTNNNHTICSAWRITGKNSFEVGWRYEYTFILGFRP